MKAIVYIRVSTEEQASSGLGLEAQRAACMAKAKALGASEVSVFADEGISGSTPVAEREGLVDALEALRKGDCLIVAKRDRLARDYMIAGWIDLEAQRKGARVVSAAGEGTDSDDPMARVMRGIVDLFAGYERDMIRARTTAALRAKRGRGEKTGGDVPFGYRVACVTIVDGRKRKTLVADAGEQAAILRARELRAQGLGFRRIGEALARDGIRGRGCSRLSPMTVRRICSEEDLASAVGTLHELGGAAGAAL